MKSFQEWISNNHPKDEILDEKKWIKGAIKHPGRCTPITKAGCTGHAKALALRFKKGDLHQ